MEKQQIVEKSVYTTLTGEVETTQATNQYQIEIDNVIVNKLQLVYRGTKITIDEETFATAVGNVDGYYFFDYEDDEWKAEGQPLDLATYGITLEGNPENKDRIYVAFFGGHITNWYGYMEYTPLYVNNTNKTFHFVSVNSQKYINVEVMKGEEKMVELSTKKIELDIEYGEEISVGAWNFQQENVDVQLILAKRVIR
ncbi:MAG: hypothetical protein K5622_07315 [Endomicrobiaceae bacterium]|nr:hypothetical protein [Endomicrobiaceae bacterium]